MKALGWRSFMGDKFISLILVFGLITFWAACTDESALDSPLANGSTDKGKIGVFDAPSVSCVDDATQTSITIKITAGATGAPAGFSLQWLTKEEYDLNGWGSAILCKAGFSGNAQGYAFNLSPGESTIVTIGDILFDTPGASSECIFDLECGTEYVFRAFAHATSTMNKSAWSSNQVCRTDACFENCVGGQGYWKNHGPVPSGNNDYTWPQSVVDDGLTLGTVSYTALQLQAILQTSGATNGLIKLAHQLIAAKLNIANGSDGASITSTITAADAMIGSLVIPPAGSGNLTNTTVAALHDALEDYNSGDGGVEYCTDQEGD